MLLEELCTTYGLERGLIAGALVLFQVNPGSEVHLNCGFKDTGLKVGATPSRMIGVIECATGAVLYEWDGDRSFQD
jgi:hypothetical protein